MIYQKGLMLIALYVFWGCSANSQKRATYAPQTTVISNQELNAENLIKKIKGCWHPILYTISDVYARNPSEIKKFMQQSICFDEDTAVIFEDTIFSIKVKYMKKIDKPTWIFQNIDADRAKAYDILGSEIWDIALDCRIRTAQKSKSTYRTTTNFAYDGKYLFYGMDGFDFLLVKYPSDIKKDFGTGSTVKQFALSGKEKSLNMFYEFYTDPDEIIVYDQNGKELYHSEMVSTKQEKNANIKLDNTTKFTVKIISKNTDSRWAFWFDTK